MAFGAIILGNSAAAYHTVCATTRAFPDSTVDLLKDYAYICTDTDVPGHTLAENQMVSGSDTFLEKADAILGGKGEVTVTVSDSLDENSTPFMAKLNMRSHNQWGATYILSGPMARRYNAVGFELWICDVTHDVLGEHPKEIYILDIK